MGAEDLEILVSGLQGWRAGKDLIDALSLVDARGPAFFGELQGEWSKRLAEIIRFPGSTDLRAIMVPAKADLLAAGLRDSVRQACDDFLAVESLVPWDIRDAMLSFKHGLLWLVPASAPLETDAIGLGRIDKGSQSSFVIWRRGKIGTLFAGSDEDLSTALEVTKVSSGLRRFVAEAVVTEVESRSGKWGIALYGETADDPAQRSAAAEGLAAMMEKI